jgi:Zn-dependent protease/CBS domain-containing protein
LLGVSVTADWSWLLIVGLLTWSLATVAFPDAYPGHSTTAYVVMALVAGALFFASLLAHELCHSLQSRREGVDVVEIRLFLFGGVSETEGALPSPGAEARMVAAGPAATVVLGLAFWAAALLGGAAGLPEVATGLLSYLGGLNLLLLVFNLLPALPLDGGRLLHAWLWRRSGNPARATLSAAVAGRALGGAMVLLGLLGAMVGDVSAMWLAFVGWFLLMALQQEVRAARALLAIDGLAVQDLMATSLVTLSPSLTIAGLAELLRRVPPHFAYPVVEDGELVGLLVLGTAGRVPMERRSEVQVRDLMVPPDAVPHLSPELTAVDAVRRLSHAPNRALVLDRTGHLVGVLAASDLSRYGDADG